MKTMSDFIMEQEITTSSANDDMEIMEGFMKLSAIGAVAECYCEHAAIAAFSEEAGINVFTESDDNVMKKAWNATKEFFSKIWEWLKSLISGIIRFFTKSSVDRLIVKLKELKNEGKLKNTRSSNEFNDYTDELETVNKEILKGIDPNSLDVDAVFKLVHDFSEEVKKGAEGFKGENSGIKGFISQAEDFLKKDAVKDKFKANDEKSTDLDAVIAVLERMSAADIPSKGRKLLKKLEFDKSNYKKGSGDDAKVDKDLVKDIKKAANLVAKAYDTYVDNTVKLVNKVLKKNLKETDYKEKNKFENQEYKDLDKAKKTTNESYEENTDGYFFL